MGEERKKIIFIGPAQVPYWKFIPARWWIWFRLHYPVIRYIPGVKRVTSWAFDVVVGSRDFEVTDDSEVEDDSE